MNEHLYNNKSAEYNRRELRKNLTKAEAFLWRSLKNKQLEGRKFRRQYSVGTYILDFYCPEERLAIELDGAAHFTDQGQQYDAERTAFLEANDIQVLRFENDMVLHQPEAILDAIRNSFKK